MKYYKFLTGILALSLLTLLPCSFAAAQVSNANGELPADYKITEYEPLTPIPDMPGVFCNHSVEGLYDLNQYIHIKKADTDMVFVKSCCEAHEHNGNCNDHFSSFFDGNNLTLCAAANRSLRSLRYFVLERKFHVDESWRQDRGDPTDPYDINGYSELMHAIANNHLSMVKFLLGKETAQDRPDFNTVMYSNPRRFLPHENPKYSFKHDARDFTRWLWREGKFKNKDILDLVEQAWLEAKDYGSGEGPDERRRRLIQYAFMDGYYPFRKLPTSRTGAYIINVKQQIMNALSGESFSNNLADFMRPKLKQSGFLYDLAVLDLKNTNTDKKRI